MKLILIAILVGKLTITSYRSVPEQTDDSPFITSTGEHVNPHGVAVSQDLLTKNGGPIDYGDLLYIEGYGFKVVNDTMNIKIKNHLDIWVETKAEEKKVGVKKRKAWIVRANIKGE